MSKAKRSRRGREMSPVHANAAAIDIGATMHVAAVGPDRDAEPVRSFGTFTADLHRLAAWFKQCGVRTVAMESTGVYWIPVFEILEQLGLTVVLVNARDAKHVPGRKTDVTDAQWPAAAARVRGCCEPASDRSAGLRRCGTTCVSESGCWIMPRPTSSTCRKR